MAYLKPSQALIDITRAIGLDPKRVRNVRISFGVNEIPHVETEMYIDKEQTEALMIVVKKYHLICDDTPSVATVGA